MNGADCVTRTATACNNNRGQCKICMFVCSSMRLACALIWLYPVCECVCGRHVVTAAAISTTKYYYIVCNYTFSISLCLPAVCVVVVNGGGTHKMYSIEISILSIWTEGKECANTIDRIFKVFDVLMHRHTPAAPMQRHACIRPRKM